MKPVLVPINDKKRLFGSLSSMNKMIPLFAATLAFGAVACSPGEKLPTAPVAKAAAASISVPEKPKPLKAERPPAPIQTAAITPPPKTLPQSRPATPLYTPRPVAEAPTTAPIEVVEEERQATPEPIEIPEPIEVAATAPAAAATPIAATRATSQLRTTPARPPARTELERLNPGMPRLVGPAPRSESYIARPRIKPNRTAPSRAHGGSHTGFAIPNTPSPAGYSTSLETPPSIEYDIPHIPQEEPLWCWAAAAQQAIGWVNDGQAPAQCAIVAMAHGIDVDKCCNDREGVCARTGEIPAIASLVRQFGGQAVETATVPRKPKEVYDILQTGATLLIRLRPAPHDAAVGIRHMIVVRGIEWLRLPNGRLEATLFYNDPLGSGYRAVSFAEIEGFFEQALIVRRSI